MNHKAIVAVAIVVLMAGCALATPQNAIKSSEKGIVTLGSAGKLLPPFVDKGVDTNSSGKFEFLLLEANVSVTSKGNFKLLVMYNLMGGPFGNQNSTIEFLEKGNHTLKVYLEGKFFGTSNLSGPYKLEVQLLAVDMNEEVLLENATHNTKSYKATDFESLPRDVSISGTLEDAQTSNPVPGFVAVAMPNKFAGFATTDLNGKFNIAFPTGLCIIFARDVNSNYVAFMQLMVFDSGSYLLDMFLHKTGPVNANVSGEVKNVSGAPIDNATLTFVNYTKGFTAETTTDSLGQYSTKLPDGQYMILASKDRFYSNASIVDLKPGKNAYNVTLKPSPDVNKGVLELSTWDQAKQVYNMTGYSGGLSIRMQADLLGKRDMYANRTEVKNFIDFMLSSGSFSIPNVNTFDSFYVDDIFYDQVIPLTFTFETQGSVMDGHIPIYMNATTEYKSNQSIPLKKDHDIRVNTSYDGDTDIILPYAYETTASNQSANATVTATSVVSIHMAPDPDANDRIKSEWVGVTASAVIPGYIAGIVKDKKGVVIPGANVSTIGANATTDIQGRYNLTVDLGTYTVTASKPGFSKEVATAVIVHPGKTTSLDFLLKTVPDAPKSLQASAGDALVNLSWTAPTYDGGDAVKKYNVYRGDSPTTLALLTSATGTTYSDAGLTNGKTYYYAVSAVNSVGEGQQTAAVNAKPEKKATKPLPPSNLNAVAGDGYVDLTWTSSQTVNVTYNIYRSTTPGGGYTLIKGNVTDTSYKDASVINGVTYYYVITAKGASGLESNYSNEMSATPKGQGNGPTRTDYALVLGAMIVCIVLFIIIILALKLRKRPAKEEEPPSLKFEKGKEEEKDEAKGDDKATGTKDKTKKDSQKDIEENEVEDK